MTDTQEMEPPMARDDEYRVLWEAIRQAQADAAAAVRVAQEIGQELKVHQAECRGNQKMIEAKLSQLTHIGWMALSALGTCLGGIVLWALPKLLGG